LVHPGLNNSFIFKRVCELKFNLESKDFITRPRCSTLERTGKMCQDGTY
jgi:hypothetical protein